MNIGEASSLTSVSADTMKHIGLIMPFKRVNGIRKFNERNINQINFVNMREAGFVDISK